MDDSLHFYTNASGTQAGWTNRLDIIANGNVGIGTTSPGTKLDVAQNTAIRVGNAYVSSGGAQYAHFASNAWFNGAAWQIPNSSRRSGLIQFSDDSFAVYQTQTPGGADFTPRLVISTGGSVTINGMSLKPVYRLYHPPSGQHLWTTGVGERNALLSQGWRDEGIAFYAFGP